MHSNKGYISGIVCEQNLQIENEAKSLLEYLKPRLKTSVYKNRIIVTKIAKLNVNKEVHSNFNTEAIIDKALELDGRNIKFKIGILFYTFIYQA